ncbi:MAG TPA: hypothetical protein VMU84_20190 [Thermoanaerobaculia bacterium]|nr:hypothetical protein [Thermoanaerobaculia bacterium]
MRDAFRAVTILRRRMAFILFARRFLAIAAIWCAAWGGAILIARLTSIGTSLNPAWGLALLPLLLVAAVLHARRAQPSIDQLTALLDAHAGHGGLLMASRTIDLGAWEVRETNAPRISWNSRKPIGLAIASGAFVIAAAFVPASSTSDHPPLDVSADVQRLETRVQLLKEEQVIPPERAEVLANALDQLKQEAAGDDPAKAWETLDSIDDATTRAAREAADAAVRRAEELTKAEAMANALADGTVDPSKLAEGMRDLEAETKDDGLLDKLSPELQQAIKNHTLSEKQLEQLAHAAKMTKEQLRHTLQKMRSASMIDEKSLRQFDSAAESSNRDDLARFLKQNASETRLSDAVGQFCLGKGGVDRGRGDAPMFFGDESDENGKFKEQTLPPAAAASLAQSQLVAVSAGAPDADGNDRSTGGALTQTPTGGGSALTPVVLPRHRGTVQRFFERKTN